MIELITAIALLCQVHPSTGNSGYNAIELKDVGNFQLQCQQEYLKCTSHKGAFDHTVFDQTKLPMCVLNKSVNK
jgi:hypothetical protein